VAERPSLRTLVICSNSTWDPAIRRDHALALLAADQGHCVEFLEKPMDVRALKTPSARRHWIRGWHPSATSTAVEDVSALRVRSASTVAPGHRGGPLQRFDALSLRRAIRLVPDVDAATVVATVPWQWDAAAGAPARRRVFDAADDWTRLMPHRAAHFRSTYARIAKEADAIIVVSGRLVDLFPGGCVDVVPNGVMPELVAETTPGPIDGTRLTYVGTLSERFDAPLMREVLERLPGWRLDLYGECQYAGHGYEPGRELAELLNDMRDRVAWHGVAPRRDLPAILDRATVLVVPNRRSQSVGQDSMKAYDYAARGRPIVSTGGRASGLSDAAPPHVLSATTAEAFAEAVLKACDEPLGFATDRIEWARAQVWARRWPVWSSALFGTPTVQDVSE
jgi:glycosyltransferase involved in cell wall biosynthesis